MGALGLTFDSVERRQAGLARSLESEQLLGSRVRESVASDKTADG